MLVRKIVVLSILGLLLFVALGVGIMMAFGWLEAANPLAGLLVASLTLLVTIPLLIGVRKLALVMGTD